MIVDHRAEALKALAHVETMLASPEALDALRWHMIRTTLHYAAAEVASIQQVKRRRWEPETEGL